MIGVKHIKARIPAWMAILAGLIFIGGCSSVESLQPDQYVRWVENEENGLRTSKSIGNFNFTLQYKPIEYVVVKEEREPRLKKEVLKRRKEELKGMQYFTLKMESKDGRTEALKNGITEPNEYYSRLEYFTTWVNADIKLVEGKDTLPCVLSHFERNYGLAPFNNLVIAFDLEDEDSILHASTPGVEKDKLIIFNDRVLGSGPLKFRIKQSSINNIPKLETI